MIVSKVGFHSNGSNQRGYGAALKCIADAGRQVALIKCRDAFDAVSDPLHLWLNVPIVGAFTEFDRLPFDYAAFEKRAKLNPSVNVWEVLNEEDAPSTYAAKADLYISLASSFADRGWALCMFNCGSGNPPLPHEDNGVSFREIARACRYMLDHGFRAYLGLHEYESDKQTIGRYRYLADYLQERNCLLPIVIGEWGWETCENKANKYLEWVKAHDATYMQDDRIVGCALWTLGGRGWGGSNYQTILPQLGDYIATVSAPVTPPAPPVTPPQPVTIEERLTEVERRVTALEARAQNI